MAVEAGSLLPTRWRWVVRDGAEGWIKADMELGRDTSGFQAEDKGDILRTQSNQTKHSDRVESLWGVYTPVLVSAAISRAEEGSETTLSPLFIVFAKHNNSLLTMVSGW